jgi:hypothetical protein
LGRLGAEYEFTTVEEILAKGLHEHLDDLQSKLNAVGASIFQTFFARQQETVAELPVEPDGPTPAQTQTQTQTQAQTEPKSEAESAS